MLDLVLPPSQQFCIFPAEGYSFACETSVDHYQSPYISLYLFDTAMSTLFPIHPAPKIMID